MKVVGIDCFKLQKGQGKSIGIYVFAEALINNLKKYNTDFKIIVLGNKDNKHDFDLEGIEFIEIPWNHRKKSICVLWELFIVKYFIKKHHMDKIIFPRGFAPIGRGDRNIIVVHDMIPFYYHAHFPGVFNPIENTYIMRRLRSSIQSSLNVVTISEYSKNEIERITGCKDGKVTVIHHGYDEVTDGLEGEQKREEDYIIGITSNLPHKNAIGLIDAYVNYAARVNKPLKMVIVGIDNIEPYIKGANKELYNSIICKKYLDDEQFYAWFRKAKCLLFLSLIEGYGRPPLEAMQFGIPVICSNRSSLPEIVGNAAVLVDPENAGEVAWNLQNLLEDKAAQEKYIKAGKENLKRFLWESQIKKYIDLL